MKRKILIVWLVVNSLATIYFLRRESKSLVVICESGSFEPQPYNPNDPFLREKAICNLTDSNGPSVTVLLID